MTSKSIVSFFAIIMFLIVSFHFMAAKIKREADILCPPPEFISVVDYFIATISQITASHRYLANSLSSVLKLIVCNQHSLKFLYRFQNL